MRMARGCVADDAVILILAGGASSRMRGRDKLLEDVGGVPLLRRVADRALATGAPVFVALPARHPPRVAALEGLAVTILACAHAADGMGATLRDAVAQLPPCARFMVLPADLPEIGTADMRRMLEPGGMPIRRATTDDGRPGHPVVFDAALRPDFAGLDGDDGAKAIVARHADRTEFVPLGGDRALRDLDTPEDWADWRARTGP